MLIIVLSCMLCILNISAKITFLQTPESIHLQQLRHNEVLEPVNNKYLTNHNEEENEEGEEKYIENLLEPDQLLDLRDAASLLHDYEVHENFYDPFSNVSHVRAKRDLGKDLANYLSTMIENLEKMEESRKRSVQLKYFEKAIEALDNYLLTVKDNKENARKNSLQIFKQERYNLLLVNCGGWLWYPIKKIKKIITCKDGVMRFTSRFQQNAQMCDSYVCKKIKM
ncbi:hypothetical protein ILUMI_09764 [Ignelater luminosus]|uniref:Uncharacterized protein n=1 Tax=Ignelater luminosus TaxID=2038154 RepID=A0A8K0GFM6_IGNLU|nr:hypothetical protein ILUMI_09764 [Ignelater luminosus]